MDFQIDHNDVRASASSFTLSDADQNKYTGFATSVNVAVSFDGNAQEFPLLAGQPMKFPENFTTIETDVATKLYLGI